ncbi:MAG: hypothetical protein DI539_21320 [Flavobacterium psychrophilum]|nr:MAG: hypothetical protein DI539_21320 [Flavobacterium psychrophilum]
MKTVFNKSVFALIMTAGLFSSCITDDDYTTPVLNCAETYLSANFEPKNVPAPENAKPFSGPEGSIIEAYVVSSDVSGNFFKTISLQTKDGSFGFSVLADVESIFRKMEPGRLVFIKMDSTYTDTEFGSLRIGDIYNETEVGRLAPVDFKEIVIPSCKIEPEDNLVRKMTIAQALNDKNINTLIELQGVEFDKVAATDGSTYFNPNNQIGGATNLNLEDRDGNTIIFRTSEYTAYAKHPVPTKSGTVRGVLTKYLDTYQFIARTENDIKLTEDRFGSAPGESVFALGGTDISYLGSFTENFESYTVNANTFPKYVNDHTAGDRYWQLKQFPAGSGNKYIEMTAFNGNGNPGINAKTYFLVPVDFTAANTFTFSKEIRYMAGQALKVYYVKEGDGGYKARFPINTANFTDITSSFTNLNYPANGESQNTFTTAGTYNIPSTLTGNGFFVFEYTGTTTVTTTIQIDDISIN